MTTHDPQQPKVASWVGWEDCVTYPDWVKKSDFPSVPVRGHMNNVTVQLAAAKAGLGMVRIPCFMGDAEPTLRRVPPGRADPCHDVWLLTHRALRSTRRVQVFMSFITEAFQQKRGLLMGECPNGG